MQNVIIGFLAPQNLYLGTRIESIAILDPQIRAHEDFEWRSFWNPIWRLIGKNMPCRLLLLDSLPQKHSFRHQNRVKSNIRPKYNRKYRFQMAAILNSNMADMKGEFRVAQYLKIFAIHQSTFVQNLILISQNAQSFWNLKLNRLTIIAYYSAHQFYT